MVRCENSLHLRGLGRYIGQCRDKRFALLREHWIPPPLERQRARRFAAQTRAAQRSREVPRIDLESVRQRQQPLVNARVELRRIFARATGEIRPPHRAHEQGVACQDEPWIGAAFEVRHEERGALRRVARRMDHADARVSQFDFFTVLHRREGHFHIGGFMEPVRIGPSGQLDSAGAMVRVDVRVDRLRELELRQLRTFVAVAELRHFARAASLCNLSQPAVSHQIALLEEEVGAILLNRARRVSLTVAGEVFLEEARRILGAVDRAHERMQEVARGAVGRIRLGATATPGLYWLPALLAAYRSQHENYDLRFEIGPIHAIAERVARNDLDMAVVAGALPSGELHARGLSQDDFVLIAPPNCALARAPAVMPNQLEAEAWLLREEGSDTRRQLAAWWHRHRLAPTRTMTFDNPDAVKRAVMAGLGIAMVSRLTVEDDLASRRVRPVQIKAGLPTREFFVVDHPHKHHGAACRAMLQLLERTCRTHTEPARPRKVAE